MFKNPNHSRFRYRHYTLIGVVLIAVLVAGAFYLRPSGTQEAPPSLKIGSVLKGQQLGVKALKAEFYFTEENIALADLYSACEGTDIEGGAFFIYGPGNEPGMQKKGWYAYPSKWAKGNNKITDPANFQVKKGRAFAFVFDEAVESTCFKNAKTLSTVAPAFGSFNSGWVQIAANDNNFIKVIEPVKDCVSIAWLQDGKNSFTEKVTRRDILKSESITFGLYKLAWIELKGCGEGGVEGSEGEEVEEPEEPEVVIEEESEEPEDPEVPAEGDGDVEEDAQSEALTESDISSMTPEVSQELLDSRHLELSWDAVPESVKGYTLQDYLLYSVAEGVFSSSRDVDKSLREHVMYVNPGQRYMIRVCARYENGAALAEYCGVEIPVDVPDVTVSASNALVNATVEAGKSDVTVLGFNIESDEDLEFDKIRIHVGGTGDLNNLYATALKGGGFQLGNTSIEGDVIVIDLADYSINAGQSRNFTLAVSVKASASVGGTFIFSLDSANDVTFKDGAMVAGADSFPISNTITIVADPVQALTDAEEEVEGDTVVRPFSWEVIDGGGNQNVSFPSDDGDIIINFVALPELHSGPCTYIKDSYHFPVMPTNDPNFCMFIAGGNNVKYINKFILFYTPDYEIVENVKTINVEAGKSPFGINEKTGFHIFTNKVSLNVNDFISAEGVWEWRGYCEFTENETQKICTVDVNEDVGLVILARASGESAPSAFIKDIRLNR